MDLNRDEAIGQVAYVVRGVATTISTDNKVAMLVFERADGERFSLAMSPEGIIALRDMARALSYEAKRRGIGPGDVTFPQVFTVGHFDHLRGTVAVMLNPDTPNEAGFVLKDESGVEMAIALRNDIQGRGGQGATAVHMPPKGRIILPGRG